jgi:nitrite reductase/ring-hydroxylating ferredoxin subunit
MAARERLICAAAALEERGAGVRFEVVVGGVREPAFLIRFEGRPRAFLNRCAHRPMELDWNPGRFFDREGALVLCATHGAGYDPRSGACRGGPCDGAGLVPLEVDERGGQVYLLEPGAALASAEGPPPGAAGG